MRAQKRPKIATLLIQISGIEINIEVTCLYVGDDENLPVR